MKAYPGEQEMIQILSDNNIICRPVMKAFIGKGGSPGAPIFTEEMDLHDAFDWLERRIAFAQKVDAFK